MKIRKKYVIYPIIVLLIVSLSFFTQINKPTICSEIEFNQIETDNEFSNHVDEKPQISANNYEILENAIQTKLEDYQTFGYFPQFYEPSLQATYYALYILNALDRINQINQTQLNNYIMAHYNNTSHLFMDKYAYRYLDSNASIRYYSLTSVLEINCYALLSLDLLGTLTPSLIDFQESIDFIWSCYNPETSGFIGQPYNTALSDCFKTSTLDNTFFAIKTIDILTDWSFFSNEKDDIVSFINELQSTDSWQWKFGGFLNENNDNFRSLHGFEPNLLSCYYAIKSLELFNLIETINIDNFHQYLSGLYDNEKKFFSIDYIDPFISNNETNLAASAIGLELSILTEYTECDTNGVVDFLLNHRNSYGTWDCSTNNKNRELIDTFDIINSLKEAGEISKLSSNDKDQIANTVQNYFYYNSFSLISNDFMALNLIYSIVNSFDLHDAISELPINFLYTHILDSSFYNSYNDILTFCACVDLQQNSWNFRSCPIEYYTDYLSHRYVVGNGLMRSHKTTFYAIDSLIKIFKLDDFAFQYDLQILIDNIISSQFLEPQYENYGSFLPSPLNQYLDIELRNKAIQFEYNYYAIRVLELLVDYLELGSICDLSFNKNSLYNHIVNKIVDTGTAIYCNTTYNNNIETIIKNTYFSIYILKAINLFVLNVEKIKNFIDQTIDYNNIENIYYCYKINEILNLDYDFDIELVHQLVQKIYSEDLNKFFLTTDRKNIDQEALLWISEMARNNALKIEISYKNSIYLGDLNTIIVNFSNLILDNFGPYITVKFESNQMGTLVLEKQQDDSYQVNFLVSINPNNFPLIDGFVRIYDKISLLGEKYLSFQTIYELNVNTTTKITNSSIFFNVNISYISFTGPSPASSSVVIAEIYKNNTFSETQNFLRSDYDKFSIFKLEYQFEELDFYDFKVIISDDYHSDNLEILDFSYNYSLSVTPPIDPDPIDPDPDPNPDPDPDPEPDTDPIISRKWQIIIFICTVFGISCVIVFGTRYYIKKGAKNAKDWFKKKLHKNKQSSGKGLVQIIIKKNVRVEDVKDFIGDVFND